MEIISLVMLVILLLITILVVREKLSFYTKTKCDICGELAGKRNNKRFKLSDGYMCEACANKNVRTNNVKGLGPNAFADKSIHDILKSIKRRAEVGDEQWAKEMNTRSEERMAEIQAKIKEINKPISIDNTPKCPKCGSTSISADKKGFGVGKAVVGAAVAGPIGLTLGNAGAKKVRITCLACGHQWMAGKK